MTDVRYSLRGDIDIESAPRLRDALQAIVIASDAHLLIDCASLTFIDSTGIAVLLETHRDLLAQGRHLLIVNVPHGPQRVFDILGLRDLLRYDRDERQEHPSVAPPSAPTEGEPATVGAKS